MFTFNIALIGAHNPAIIILLVNARYSRISINRSAAITRASGQSLRQISRLNITIARMLDRTDQPLSIHIGPFLFDFLNRHTAHFNAEGFSNAHIIFIFIHPVLSTGKTHIGNLPEAGIHAGFFLKFLIELHRIFVNFPDGIRHVEQGKQACCVPCGTRC